MALSNNFVLGCDAVVGTNNNSVILHMTNSQHFLLRRGGTGTAINLLVGANNQTSVAGVIVNGTKQEFIIRQSATQGLTLWVDGVIVISDPSATSNIASATPLQIGASIAIADHLNGTIGNITLRLGDLDDWEVIGDPPPEPTFYAPDGDVALGIGGLTTARASSAYIFNPGTGYYEERVAGEKLKMSGKLEYFPEATNVCPSSRDLRSGWVTTVSGAGNVTYDQIGLAGEANTASRVSDTHTGFAYNKYIVVNHDAISVETIRWTFKRDDTNQSFCISLQAYFWTLGERLRVAVRLDNNGYSVKNDTTTGATPIIEVVEKGDWLDVFMQLSTASSDTRTRLYLHPVQYTYNYDDTETLTGYVDIGEVAVYPGKTIAEVRGLPMIPTDGAAKTMLRTAYSYDIANHDNAQGLWYCEWEPSITGTEGSNSKNYGIIGFGATPHTLMFDGGPDNAIDGYDGVTISRIITPWSIGDVKKVSVMYHAVDAVFIANVDGTFDSVDRLYDGTMGSGGNITLNIAQLHSAKISNIRFYPTDYQVSKQIARKLMDGTMPLPTIPDINVTYGGEIITHEGETITHTGA